MFYTKFKSSLCDIFLIGDQQGLKMLHFDNQYGKNKFEIESCWVRNDIFFKGCRNQLEEFLKGARKEFDLKINPEGTEFQKRVWNQLLKIPYGKRRSYQDIAIEIGNQNAARAVGMANSRNPIPIIIPCHRVVGKNGDLVGFSSGIEIKRKLLMLEGLELE